LKAVDAVFLGIATIPAIYYFLVLYSTARFFSAARNESLRNTDFTPPVSCLKPIRGLDVEAYENYASFCRQDYPDYEILFCVDEDDPAVPVLKKLVSDFPERRIRLLYGSGRDAINDKVARLVRLVNEAQYDMLVITDGDVRVRPDYLRSVVGPFEIPRSARPLVSTSPPRKPLLWRKCSRLEWCRTFLPESWWRGNWMA
jgi:ceramide glucosyltransferase